MLQAYALQHIIIFNLGVENIIINLRTDRQKRLYSKISEKKGNLFKRIFRRILYVRYERALDRKYDLFEKFLKTSLILTKEYSSLKELELADLHYDCYISGGDQIWNTSPCDFDWSYYLPFVKTGKKISYAASMGPHAALQVSNLEKIKTYLSSYSHISVREDGTRKLVSTLVSSPIELSLDPVLLLSSDEWRQHINNSKLVNENYINEDYILVYSPGYKSVVYDIAEKIGKELGLTVVTTVYTPQMIKYHRMKKVLAVGPWEFLNLLDHAKLVISGSFHATIFSVLFNIPFFAVNGINDNRMSSFLEKVHLLDRSICISDLDTKIQRTFDLRFDFANMYLEKERINSISYLKRAIL